MLEFPLPRHFHPTCRSPMLRITCFLLLFAVVAVPVLAGELELRSIKATDESLEVGVNGPLGQAVELHALPLLPSAAAQSLTPQVVWQGKVESATIVVPRSQAGRDLTYSRFKLIEVATGKATHKHRCVTEVATPSERQFEFPRPTSIKGLQVQMVEDAIKLGIKHAGLNVSLPLLLNANDDSPLAIEVDGERIPLNPQYVASLDARVKPLTEAGVNVLAIFLNTKYGLRPGSPLQHPETRLEEAPTFVVAFNLSTPTAERRFRGALQFLAERYSRPGAPHGWLTGYIIGNEVQSHWMWANRGTVDDQVVIDEYATALRIADLAVRSQHPAIRVFASFDHFWQAKFDLPEGRSMPGRLLFDELNAISKREGDFPWGVAMHPYPENLFNPKFWEDASAPLAYDAPRITLNNIEVLTSYLRLPEMLCDGQPRLITLSEQGFHTSGAETAPEEGEALQAAAFARAYFKLQNLEGIDSFLLHRHVDHSDEGGLRLGLWTRRGDVEGSSPDRPKRIYEVFRLADTPNWREAFEFAKPLVGINDWQEALPREIP